MKKIMVMGGILVCLLLGSSWTDTRADTVYFKNGRSVEGIVKEEGADAVEISIGFGTITCNKDEVVRIERSSPGELNAINAKWKRKQDELEAKAEEFNRERERRFADYGKWARESDERRRQEAVDSKEIQVRRDTESRGILVETLLDEKVKALLVLDTGASVVVLTKRVGEQLGIKSDDTRKNGIVTLTLAGNRKIEARMTVLHSIKIKDVEVKDVLAAVLLEDFINPGFKDGLLGMSFLSQFNLKIDLKDMKMSLEKLKS